MILALLAATFTFTATATGVGKGTPLEFVFAGKNSDRDYETMFLLDEPVEDFCRRIEKAGLPRGKPADALDCRLWPVGCKLEFSPSLDAYVATTLPSGVPPAPPIYTGGARTKKGIPTAATEMPSAVFSLYTFPQPPIVFDGIYDQGVVYGSHLAAVEIKKGTKVEFSVTWDPSTMPSHLDVCVTPTNASDIVKTLVERSKGGSLDVTAFFDESLTVTDATAAAKALSLLDSPRVKLNGCKDGNLFYGAFLPDASWTNRISRLVQPFELTIGQDSDNLVFIEEDWTVDGDDPKLTPQSISFSDAAKHSKTDTCFVYADPSCRLARIFAAMSKLKGSSIRKWYVFSTICL